MRSMRPIGSGSTAHCSDVPEKRGQYPLLDLPALRSTLEPMTTPATMRPSSVLIPCPKCAVDMNVFSGNAQCDNTECEEFGKLYSLELPKFDVMLKEPE